jgi:hypothetical protein
MPPSARARFRSALLLVSVLAACDDATANVVAERPAEPPPTGQYEITARVVSDTCTPAYVAPEPWRARVMATAEGEIAKVNLVLAAIPPSSSTTNQARSDFRLEPGYTFQRAHKPVPACSDFARSTTHTMKSVSADGFTTAVEVVFGDADGCEVPGPTKCTTVVEYDHRVVEAECAARCTYGARPRHPGPAPEIVWDVDCRC